jgi:L-histidine Nalpha-methyltransferase
MTAAPARVVDVRISEAEWRERRDEELVRGLRSDPKELSPVWFYDERGSRLFDAITRLPEYYLTRAERALLAEHAGEIARAAGAEMLVELGAGTADKTTLLLDAMVDHERSFRYVPFDVSEETLRFSADRLVDEYPGIGVHAIVGDFRRHLSAIPEGGSRLVAFLGSTLGNFRPAERRRFFVDLDCMLTARDHLLLGVDLVKDQDVLLAAYDDAAGVTAAFNLNSLSVVNRETGADFDPSAFEHVAVWDERQQWIEMRLRARRAHTVHIGAPAATVPFRRGEELRTEISAKFTPLGIEAELDDGGFMVDRMWASAEFLLVLARPYC